MHIWRTLQEPFRPENIRLRINVGPSVRKVHVGGYYDAGRVRVTCNGAWPRQHPAGLGNDWP